MAKPTLLEQMESAGCLIDIDSYEPEYVKAMPFKPHDATCNTFILGAMVQDLRNREAVKEVIQKSESLSAGEIFIKLVSALPIWVHLLTCIACRVCFKNYTFVIWQGLCPGQLQECQ